MDSPSPEVFKKLLEVALGAVVLLTAGDCSGVGLDDLGIVFQLKCFCDSVFKHRDLASNTVVSLSRATLRIPLVYSKN